MSKVLFILILIVMIITLIMFKGEICTPSFLYIAGYGVSSLFLMISVKRWNYEITSNTVICVSISCILILLADIVGRICVTGRLTDYKDDRVKIIKYVSVDSLRWVCLIVVTIGVLLRLFDIILITGLNEGINFLQKYRKLSGTSPYLTIFKIWTPICFALFTFYVSNEIKLKLITSRKMNISIYILFIIYLSLASSRIEVIYVFVMVAIYFFYWYFEIKKVRINKKIIMFAGLMAFSLLASFWSLGYLTGKTQNQTSFIDNISMYAGSSLAALDDYMKRPFYIFEDGISETLFGLKNFFSLFGIDIGITTIRNKEFVLLGNMKHRTNIYTSIRSLVHDYGFTGMYIITFLEGLFLSLYYQKAKIKLRKGTDSNMIIYGYIMAIMTLSFTSERFFSSILVFTTFVYAFIVKAISITSKRRKVLAVHLPCGGSIRVHYFSTKK